MAAEVHEQFVDADTAGEFLALPRRRVLELARRKVLPGWPLGCGVRRVWRFRLSELTHAMESLGRTSIDENMNIAQSGNRLKPKRRRECA
jgi:hypothetical protein